MRSDGTYQNLELVGEGLNSRVFKGLRQVSHEIPSQVVAVKVFKHKNEVQLFEKRFQELVSVRGRHCVGILAWEKIYGDVAIVMDWVEGVSLEVLARQRLSPEIRTEVISQIQLALTELHQYGVVHGDLSLSNVLIDHNGIIKLVDFGLWKMASQTHLFGSPKTMSPECWAGAAPTSGADLFSLGLIALELVEPSSEVDLSALRERALRLRGQGSPWFAEAPSERKLDSRYLSKSSARTELAALVGRELGRQRQVRTEQSFTRVIGRTSLAGFRRWSRWASVASVIGAMLLQAPLSLGNRMTIWPSGLEGITAPSAQLSIRTEGWLWLEVDGREAGYAPLTLTGLRSGAHVLKWRSHAGAGALAIRLADGEQRIMQDQNFETQAPREKQ